MLYEIWLFIISLFQTETFGRAFGALGLLLFFWVVISVIRWLVYFTGLADYLRRFK